jgi:hypothetical protein
MLLSSDGSIVGAHSINYLAQLVGGWVLINV